MPKLFPTLGLAIILIFSGCQHQGAENSAEEEPENWKMFGSIEFGVTFRYPAGWEISTPILTEGLIDVLQVSASYYFPNDAQENSQACEVSFELVRDISPDALRVPVGESFEEYVYSLLTGMELLEGETVSSQIPEVLTHTINGKYQAFSKRNDNVGVNCMAVDYYIDSRDGDVVTVTLKDFGISNELDLNSNGFHELSQLDVLEQILNSVEFFPPLDLSSQEEMELLNFEPQ